MTSLCLTWSPRTSKLPICDSTSEKVSTVVLTSPLKTQLRRRPPQLLRFRPRLSAASRRENGSCMSGESPHAHLPVAAGSAAGRDEGAVRGEVRHYQAELRSASHPVDGANQSERTVLDRAEGNARVGRDSQFCASSWFLRPFFAKKIRFAKSCESFFCAADELLQLAVCFFLKCDGRTKVENLRAHHL